MFQSVYSRFAKGLPASNGWSDLTHQRAAETLSVAEKFPASSRFEPLISMTQESRFLTLYAIGQTVCNHTDITVVGAIYKDSHDVEVLLKDVPQSVTGTAKIILMVVYGWVQNKNPASMFPTITYSDIRLHFLCEMLQEATDHGVYVFLQVSRRGIRIVAYLWAQPYVQWHMDIPDEESILKSVTSVIEEAPKHVPEEAMLLLKGKKDRLHEFFSFFA